MSEKPAVRTDLAAEALKLRLENAEKTDALPGVEAEETNEEGFAVTTVRVLDENGAKELCKPIGNYVTVAFDALLRREEVPSPALRACSPDTSVRCWTCGRTSACWSWGWEILPSPRTRSGRRRSPPF